MAEARLEAEEQPREFRELVVLRSRRGQSNPTTDHSERNKLERRLSQGPLSSIRAAIKRTSSRSSSQGDNARDRGRPEITIISAEPLPANTWFPGASGGFPPALPLGQPPPSYDQVIKEKTQEQVPPPVATHRHSTTIATQTDFLLEANPECNATPQLSERKRSTVKRPLKPPRPSLPKAKPEPEDTAVLADQPRRILEEPPPLPTDTYTATNQQPAEAEPSPPNHHCMTQSDPSPPLPVLRDETVEPIDRSLVSVEGSSRLIEADPTSPQPKHPIPLPRSKPNLRSIRREVKVQTLVRIKDDGESPQTVLFQGGLPSGKYLQELLDFFCTDDQCYHSDPSDHMDHSHDSEQCEEDDIMSVSHSHRNIKAKIHAFEKQSAMDNEEAVAMVKPEPWPHTQYPKPPVVAAKPAFARRPSSQWELINASGLSMKEAVTPSTLLPKASSEAEISDVPETQAGKVPLMPPSRLSVISQAKAFLDQEDGSAVSPPTPPPKIKPHTYPISLNNHENTVTLPPPPPKLKPAVNRLSLDNQGPYVTLPPPPPKLKPAVNRRSLPNHGSAVTLPTPPPKIKPPRDPLSFTNHEDTFTLPPPPPKPKPARDPLSFTNYENTVTLPPPPPKLKPARDPLSFTNHEDTVTLPPPPPKLKPATDSVSFPDYEDTVTLPPPPPRLEPAMDPICFPDYENSVTLPSPPPKLEPAVNRLSLANQGPVVTLPPPPPKLKPAGNRLSLANQGPEVTVPAPPPKLKLANNPLRLANCATPSLPSRPVENGNTQRPVAKIPIKPQRSGAFGSNPPRVSLKPTMIRVPSKAVENEHQEAPPTLPAQKPIGGVQPPVMRKPSLIPGLPAEESSSPEGFSFPPASTPVLTLPPRPAGVMVPTLPPRSQSSKEAVNRGPVQPPRPNPGHPLYNKYTLEIPHAIAEFDYNGSNTGGLSFQKNEVLVLLEQIDRNTFECQVGDAKGPVLMSHLKIITPLSSASSMPSNQGDPSSDVRRGSSGLQAQVLYDFTPEGPEELALKVGDLLSMVERVDDEWYCGTNRGSTGIFPANFVRMLSAIPAPPSGQKAPPASISGPRCVARFDFEGESSDELSFSEGDVIRLREYIGQEWARGELNGYAGIFPLAFVKVVEDLPAPPPAQLNVQAKIPLPGMVSASKSHEAAGPSQAQSAPAGAEWCKAQYEFIAETDDELSFQQGAVIQIIAHVDTEWCRGHLDGREGNFPAAFVEPCPAPPGGAECQSEEGKGRARTLFDFVPEAEEELSLKAGDIITVVESIDDEWYLGELHGRRGLVPKNYVQVL